MENKIQELKPSPFSFCIGYQIVGSTTDNEIVTNVIEEDGKVFCIIDYSYEAEFEAMQIDAKTHKPCVKVK